MKHLFFTLLVLFAFGAAAQETKAPLSPAASSEAEFVKVSYGQPSVRGREIFGALVPYGEVWRTGANAATEITFTKNVDFGGKKVKAGTYTLFTIPGEKEWSVVLNSSLKQWGAFDYDKIKKNNVAEVKVSSEKLSEKEEKLQIKVSDTQLYIAWDDTAVKVPLKF